MSILEILDLPSSKDAFVIITDTDNELIKIFRSDSFQPVTLNNTQNYVLIYFSLTPSEIHSVSFTPLDLPTDSSVLYLSPDFSDNNYPESFSKTSSVSLKIKVQRFFFNLEDNSKNYLTENYMIDEEPLIEITSSHHSDHMLNESMINEAYQVRIENYKLIIENEQNLRTKAESKVSELVSNIKNQFETYAENEKKIRSRLEGTASERTRLLAENDELKVKNESILAELSEQKEKFEIHVMVQKYSQNESLEKELELYKQIVEKSDKKWDQLVTSLETTEENDPIHLVIKQKDMEIAELAEKLKKAAEVPWESEINLRLEQKKLNYARQQDLVYLVNGVKIAVSLSNGILTLRKLGGYLSLEEVSQGPSHKRTVSDLKFETPKSSIKKTKFPDKKFLSPTYGFKN